MANGKEALASTWKDVGWQTGRKFESRVDVSDRKSHSNKEAQEKAERLSGAD